MFQEYLRAICEAGHITARDIARESGLHEDSIGRYLVGLRPSVESKRLVQDALRRLLVKREREVEAAKLTLTEIA